MDPCQSSNALWMDTTVCCMKKGRLDVVTTLLSVDGIDINNQQREHTGEMRIMHQHHWVRRGIMAIWML